MDVKQLLHSSGSESRDFRLTPIEIPASKPQKVATLDRKVSTSSNGSRSFETISLSPLTGSKRLRHARMQQDSRDLALALSRKPPKIVHAH